MIYRPVIDSLRAIAVIAIVLFHTEIDLFSKAFIGVDFFVISGYLITGLIVGKQKNESFRLGYFNRRRVRGLFPPFYEAVNWSVYLPNSTVKVDTMNRKALNARVEQLLEKLYMYDNRSEY